MKASTGMLALCLIVGCGSMETDPDPGGVQSGKAETGPGTVQLVEGKWTEPTSCSSNRIGQFSLNVESPDYFVASIEPATSGSHFRMAWSFVPHGGELDGVGMWRSLDASAAHLTLDRYWLGRTLKDTRFGGGRLVLWIDPGHAGDQLVRVKIDRVSRVNEASSGPVVGEMILGTTLMAGYLNQPWFSFDGSCPAGSRRVEQITPHAEIVLGGVDPLSHCGNFEFRAAFIYDKLEAVEQLLVHRKIIAHVPQQAAVHIADPSSCRELRASEARSFVASEGIERGFIVCRVYSTPPGN